MILVPRTLFCLCPAVFPSSVLLQVDVKAEAGGRQMVVLSAYCSVLVKRDALVTEGLPLQKMDLRESTLPFHCSGGRE